MDVNPVLVADLQAPEAVEPGERPFNGLITNDKFCLTRSGRLRLLERRRPVVDSVH